jgi:para-aminobenzoate synthetase component 1
MQKKNLKWLEPLELAQRISHNYQEKNWVFLYSALHKKIKNSRSYIALFAKDEIVSDDFSKIEKKIKNDEKWLGYLSYELVQDFEKLPKTKKSFIDLAKIHLINFSLILEFDHSKRSVTANFDDQKKLDEVLKYKAVKEKVFLTKVKKLDSNFSDESYLKAISEIKKMIANGDFYQTNLTRKFFGNFSKKLGQKENFQLFSQLTKLSPANYSAFLKLGKNFVISSSPELFLKIEKNRSIFSRPIKGTAPRNSDKKQDQKNKSELKNSAKERAENLMIVDLMRNDFSRICDEGSVKVKKLFEITSYENIHHMSSEVHGQISKKFSNLDAIKACFPAGSMTGAPKIKAMEIAAKKEKINRGIYSGAIGFLDKKSANLSVVIRTLISSEDKFEFQVGGAITFDSDPQMELQEIFNKAKGISKLLKI